MSEEVVGQTAAFGNVTLTLDLVGTKYVNPEKLGNVVRRALLDVEVEVDGVPYRVRNVILDTAETWG